MFKAHGHPSVTKESKHEELLSVQGQEEPTQSDSKFGVVKPQLNSKFGVQTPYPNSKFGIGTRQH